MVLVLFCELVLIKLHTNVNYDTSWDTLAFQACRCKIKVTVAYGGACITFSDFYAPEGTSGGILKLHRPSVCPSICSSSVRPSIANRVLAITLRPIEGI